MHYICNAWYHADLLANSRPFGRSAYEVVFAPFSNPRVQRPVTASAWRYNPSPSPSRAPRAPMRQPNASLHQDENSPQLHTRLLRGRRRLAGRIAAVLAHPARTASADDDRIHPASGRQLHRAGFVSTARLLDFPTSFVGAFSVPFMNMPLGFIAIAWWFAAWLIVPAAYRRYRASRAAARHERLCGAQSARGWSRPPCCSSSRYHSCGARHTRSPLCPTPVRLARARISARLAEEIHVDDPDTSRIITWDFIFDGDNRFTTTAPTSTRSSTCCRTHPQRPTSRSSGTS